MENTPKKTGMHPVVIFILCVVGFFAVIFTIDAILPDLPESQSAQITTGQSIESILSGSNISTGNNEDIKGYTTNKYNGSFDHLELINNEHPPVGNIANMLLKKGYTEKELQGYCDRRLNNDNYVVKFYTNKKMGVDNFKGSCFNSDNQLIMF